MKTNHETQSDLEALLEQASREGEARIQRADGRIFLLKPENASRSPLDVPGIDLGISTDEIVDFIHEGRGRP